MQHPFDILLPEIARNLAHCQILPAREARATAVAKHLLSFAPVYRGVTDATRVPVLVIAPLHERESDADFSTYLGNGDRLDAVTRHVPRGRGAFLDSAGRPDWRAGAIDALTLDRLNAVQRWSFERAVYEEEAFNGFGPRDHGRYTGYVWGGTNIYNGGKYVADGQWDPDWEDTQLGCVALMLAMAQLEPALALPHEDPAWRGEPAPMGGLITPPLPSPLLPAGVLQDTAWLQRALTKLERINPPLRIDGNYGRRTRNAVHAFQASHDLTVDGIAGPQTLAAIEAALKGRPQ